MRTSKSIGIYIILIIAILTISMFNEAVKPAYGNEENNLYDRLAAEPMMTKDRFSLHPTYFIWGSGDTKFQIAFIWQIYSEWELYLGYSQVMFWDLDTYSAPMTDINCSPDFYYKFCLDYGFLKSIDLGIWEHMSNFQGGEDSRGWDRSYIELNTFFPIREIGISLNFKFFIIYRLDEYSNDLDSYMGFWELNLTVNFYQRVELLFRIFGGDEYSYKFSRGGQEIGLTFKFRGFDPRLYLQFYNGYVESLLDYDKRTTHIRYGFLVYM